MLGKMAQYPWMPLREIRKYEPMMRKLKVSVIARSPRGFLMAYKHAKGIRDNMSEPWHRKRAAFIARTLPQYLDKPTYRRKLALIAWAYMPQSKGMVV